MANLNTLDIAALNAQVVASPLDNFGTAGVIITGAWVGTISFQGSLDGINFVNILAHNLTTNVLTSTTTANGQFIINTSGMRSVRARLTAYTSGTASVVIQGNAATAFSRSLATISGSSDGTTIGNVGDRLKVDASVVLAGGATQSYTSKLRYDDMNTSTGTLARGASVTIASGWNKVYGYSGSGALIGCVISLETKDDWQVRIVIDGEELFGTGTGNGILSTDLTADAIYDTDPSGKSIPELDQDLGIFWGQHDRFMWCGPILIPVSFNSSVDVYVRRAVGSSTKKFQAGYVVIEKVT